MPETTEQTTTTEAPQAPTQAPTQIDILVELPELALKAVNNYRRLQQVSPQIGQLTREQIEPFFKDFALVSRQFHQINLWALELQNNLAVATGQILGNKHALDNAERQLVTLETSIPQNIKIQ